MSKDTEYEELELEITDEEKDKYVDLYCQIHLNGCSLQLYNEVKETSSVKEALYHGVLNQIINDALRQEVERISLEQGDVGC